MWLVQFLLFKIDTYQSITKIVMTIIKIVSTKWLKIAFQSAKWLKIACQSAKWLKIACQSAKWLKIACQSPSG